jgi:hypothetical protein
MEGSARDGGIKIKGHPVHDFIEIHLRSLCKKREEIVCLVRIEYSRATP